MEHRLCNITLFDSVTLVNGVERIELSGTMTINATLSTRLGKYAAYHLGVVLNLRPADIIPYARGCHTICAVLYPKSTHSIVIMLRWYQG